MRYGLTVVAAIAALALAGPAAAGHVDLPAEIERDTLGLPADFQGAGSAADIHSDNMGLLANFDDGGTYREGTDLAFWGKTAVAGAYNTLRVLDISDAKTVREVGQLECPGNQNDVSIWGDLVFMSVDSPRRGPECGSPGDTVAAELGLAWEGIRIISIADPANPVQIGTVKTDCGSHTHTLVPDTANNRVLLYVLSYPLVQQADCSVASHRKISVVEVPLSNPTAARVISTPDVSPAIGCHDVSVFLARRLAAAACLTESQIWDISDPANPRVVSHIVNPAINIHHSSAWAWDGDTIVIGDELGGAAAAPGCMDPHEPLGMLWFYDVRDPAAPAVRGTYRLPEQEQTQQDSLFCTAHNFNPVPLKNGKDILVSAWYNGGTTVLDFTDPSQPFQIGYYIAKEPVKAANWSSYWYDGLIYANSFDASYIPSIPQSRGIDVLAIAHPDLKASNQYKLRRLNPQTQELLATKKQ
jgi:hypothetical protein